MDAYFSYVTCIVTAVIFGLEFLASIYVGAQNGFGFPALYLGVSCIFGVISYALSAAALAGSFIDFRVFPGYYYALTLFSYLQLLMLLFLPVLAIFLLIRQHNQSGGNGQQTPTAVKAMVYIGIFFATLAVILIITFLGLSGALNSASDYYSLAQESIATSMILWYFIIFWIIVAPFYRSIQLQPVSTFIAYGVSITLPMIITTITIFEPAASPIFPAGQYANFALYSIPLFFAVGIALINAHRWITLDDYEQHHPRSV